jgi:hypothetical protein
MGDNFVFANSSERIDNNKYSWWRAGVNPV